MRSAALTPNTAAPGSITKSKATHSLDAATAYLIPWLCPIGTLPGIRIDRQAFSATRCSSPTALRCTGGNLWAFVL